MFQVISFTVLWRYLQHFYKNISKDNVRIEMPFPLFCIVEGLVNWFEFLINQALSFDF